MITAALEQPTPFVAKVQYVDPPPPATVVPHAPTVDPLQAKAGSTLAAAQDPKGYTPEQYALFEAFVESHNQQALYDFAASLKGFPLPVKSRQTDSQRPLVATAGTNDRH